MSRVTSLIPARYGNNNFALLTSGGTSEPKLIIGNKARFENLVRALHELQTNEPVSETVCVLPLAYSYAFINRWLWAFVFKKEISSDAGLQRTGSLERFIVLGKQCNALHGWKPSLPASPLFSGSCFSRHYTAASCQKC